MSRSYCQDIIFAFNQSDWLEIARYDKRANENKKRYWHHDRQANSYEHGGIDIHTYVLKETGTLWYIA